MHRNSIRADFAGVWANDTGQFTKWFQLAFPLASGPLLQFPRHCHQAHNSWEGKRT